MFKFKTKIYSKIFRGVFEKFRILFVIFGNFFENFW